MGGLGSTLGGVAVLLVAGAAPAVAGQPEPADGLPVTHGQTTRYVDRFTSEGRCGVDVGGFFSEERQDLVVVAAPGSPPRTILRSVTFTNLRTGASVRFSGPQRARLTEAGLCAILLPLGI